MSKDNEFLYQDGEKVFCYHGNVIYEAKVVATKYYIEPNRNPKTGSIGPHYFIHYAGWKSSWDEWVDEPRVLKYNEANLEKHEQMIKSLKKQKPAIKRTINDSPSEKSKKRKREPLKEKEEIIKKPKPNEIISVPEPLRAILYRDWENIQMHKLLVPLPRKPNVTDIIDDYRKHRLVSKGAEHFFGDGIEQEVVNGLHFYFNKCIGTRLLYKKERKQYRVIRLKNEHLDNSQIFGAEHFLRLFVEFPQLMANTSLSQETLSVLKDHLSDFLNFLNENRSKYFIKDYEEIRI